MPEISRRVVVGLLQFLSFNHLCVFFRYQFCLQVKQDILQGRLPVAPDLASELSALAVQC